MSMEYRLNKVIESWDDEMYDDLCAKIRSRFMLCGKLILVHNEISLDDIRDIRDEFEGYENDPEFKALHINVTQGMKWQEFITMFSNIGWNETISDKYEDIQSMDKKLYEIVSVMIEQNANPSSIKDKETFIDKLGDEYYDTHKQYIDAHLELIQKIPSNPTLLSDLESSPDLYVYFYFNLPFFLFRFV